MKSISITWRGMQLLLPLVIILFLGNVQPLSANATIRVAVVERTGGGGGGGAATVAQLNDDTFFNFIATLVDPSGIDSAAELANYDAVVLGGSGLGNDPIWTVAMASAVRDFVEGGGGLLMTGWGHWNSFSGGTGNAAPAAILDTVVPGELDASYSNQNGNSLNLTDLTHPITQGLPSSIPYGTGCCLEYNRHSLQPGDVSLGVPSSNPTPTNNALIYRENIGGGNGRSVYLGALHLASLTTYPSVQSGLRSGSGDQLIEQALGWLAAVSAIEVDIDIKPNSDPSSFGCNSEGNLPVAVLGSATFDATEINADTVRFGSVGDEAAEVHQKSGSARRHVEDFNEDGFQDMIFHFSFADTGFSCSDIPAGNKSADVTGNLTGELDDGTAIVGQGILRLVAK